MFAVFGKTLSAEIKKIEKKCFKPITQEGIEMIKKDFELSEKKQELIK